MENLVPIIGTVQDVTAGQSKLGNRPYIQIEFSCKVFFAFSIIEPLLPGQISRLETTEKALGSIKAPEQKFTLETIQEKAKSAWVGKKAMLYLNTEVYGGIERVHVKEIRPYR